jgi:hypothetical protein
MSLKHELQRIISGDGTVKHGETIQAITDHIRRKKNSILDVEKTEFFKEQETQILVEFIDLQNFWYTNLEERKYIGEGAEQKIYEFSESEYVLKLNNTIFYAFWEDYFYSLLLHNFFFPHLAYQLLGFIKTDQLHAVVKQPYVQATEKTDLSNVKIFLSANGFLNKRDNDYFNPDLGIILEDLHDENVLTKEGTLQFIDTVFFLMPSFLDGI